MNCSKKQCLLYLVTDRSWLKGKTLAQQVEVALKNGVTMVQIREKTLPKNEFIALAKEIKKLTDKYSVPLIVNDNLEVAQAVDAAGIHIGQGDLNCKKAREALGPKKIIGVSASTPEEALIAAGDGADYLGVGAVFPTSSKDDASPVSHETLKAICKNTKLPVVAIGGINKDNLKELAGTGIAGIAVISAILAAPDIEQAAGELAEILAKVVK